MLKGNLSATLKGENQAEEWIEAIARDLKQNANLCIIAPSSPVSLCLVAWKPKVLVSYTKTSFALQAYFLSPRGSFGKSGGPPKRHGVPVAFNVSSRKGIEKLLNP